MHSLAPLPCRRALSRLASLALLALALLPAACATPPQGQVVATLPPPRVLVETAHNARIGPLLDRRIADLVAEELREGNLPATSRTIGVSDYRVRTDFRRSGRTVTARFTVTDIQGATLGTAESEPGAFDRLSRGDVALFQAMIKPATGRITELVRARESARQALPGTQPLTLPRGGARVALLPPEAFSPEARAQVAEQTRAALRRFGLVPQDGREGADFIVRPFADRKGMEGGRRRMEFTLDLTRRDGAQIGTIAQVKLVPAGQETSRFTALATEVSEVSAAGVAELIGRAGRDAAAHYRRLAGMPPVAEAPLLAAAPPPAPTRVASRRR